MVLSTESIQELATQELKMTSTFLDHIILCPRNNQVHDINEAILQQFNPTAEVYMLQSVDFVSEEDGIHYAYSVELSQFSCDPQPQQPCKKMSFA